MRRVSWIGAAWKGFSTFPTAAKERCITALRLAAQGRKADIAKPMKGLGWGVFEIALAYRGDAYRVIYAVQLDEDILVVHVFQKKATRGIKTSTKEIDLARSRLKRLKEERRR